MKIINAHRAILDYQNRIVSTQEIPQGELFMSGSGAKLVNRQGVMMSDGVIQDVKTGNSGKYHLVLTVTVPMNPKQERTERWFVTFAPLETEEHHGTAN